METLTNAASAASRAIFGETNSTQPGEEPVSGKMGDTTKGEPLDAGNSTQPGQEPVSGEMGDTTKGEPYDAGNLGYSTNTDLTNPETNTTKGTSTEKTYLPVRGKENILTDMDSSNPTTKSDVPGNTSSTVPIRPEHEHDKTGVTDAPQPSTGFTSDKPSSSNEPSASGPEPSVSANPSSGAKDTQKQQGADRPEQEPNSDEHQRIQEAKKEAEEAQGVDVSGPGPVSLQDKAKVGGVTTSAGGDDDGPQKESHGEGTGEKYVKSSGLKSDGGDFDAANPGAAKEADRLLDEKGIHHSSPGEKPAEDDAESGGPSESPSGKKPSLKEKIKAKLHHHKN